MEGIVIRRCRCVQLGIMLSSTIVAAAHAVQPHNSLQVVLLVIGHGGDHFCTGPRGCRLTVSRWPPRHLLFLWILWVGDRGRHITC
eukprot:13452446-Alexandrium_andersonii.AAC.1